MKHLEKQRGATLIVSLIFLVVLSIIGLAGMDVTSLEEKMAGNMRDRNVSFQAAEAALREGERFLQSTVFLPAFDGTNGLYDLPTDGSKRWNTVDWSSVNDVRFYTGLGFDELNTQAAYIIESLVADSAAETYDPTEIVDNKRFYRITARSEGLSGASEVILQTVYKR